MKYIIPVVNTYQVVPLQISSIVYDVLGNEVSNLVNEDQDAGIYEIVFDASALRSGVYFFQ